MPKKPNIRAEDITEKDILPLYEGVLPLLYRNPEKLDLPNQLNKLLLRMVHYELFHYTMDDSKPFLPSYSNQFSFNKWIEPENQKGSTELTSTTVEDSDPASLFQKAVSRNYETMVNHIHNKFGEKQNYYYHRLESYDDPKIAIGFFRLKKGSRETPFSQNEIRLFEKLTSHIFLILRTVLTPLVQTQTFQSVHFNMSICSKIAYEYSLSDSESRFLPEILFGHSNEEIAYRLYVSIATVKKHLQHIFQKTGTKNRVDFISKFFTAPSQLDI